MEDFQPVIQRCSIPPAVDDLDLLAAMDGEAEPEVLQHLERCPFCARRARRFANTQAALRRKLYRIFCPSSAELVGFYERTIERWRLEAIATHVADCPHCSRELSLLDDRSGTPLDPWPPPLRPRRFLAEPAPVVSERCAATALSSLSSLFPRHYAYRSGDVRLFLNVARAGSHGTLWGVLLPGQDLAYTFLRPTLSLWHDNDIVLVIDLEPNGRFEMRDVPAGEYRLSLRYQDYEMVVDHVQC